MRKSNLYESFLAPLCFGLEPESAHDLAISLLRCAGRRPLVLRGLRRCYDAADERLKVAAFGLNFPNPIGLAAGFDKNAVAFHALASLGFGFVEVGTVTALAQPGNPKPRIFRLTAHRALINRLGFNNDGAEAIESHLASLRGAGRIDRPLGINLGKSKATPIERATEDYLKSFRLLRPFADYIVVNISSPNTPDLRKLQEKERLDELLGALQQQNLRNLPLLVKIAPDLSFEQIDDVLALIDEHKAAGVIATNTTTQRPGISHPRTTEVGGLSGRPLRDLANRCIRHIWKQTQGKMPIVGVGGVFTAEDAYEKILYGASLVQVYTGLIHVGPSLAARINRGLLELMDRDGVKQMADAIGKA